MFVKKACATKQISFIALFVTRDNKGCFEHGKCVVGFCSHYSMQHGCACLLCAKTALHVKQKE